MDKETEYELRQYSPDKPKSCEYCYFWTGKRTGCSRPQCYYLLPAIPKSQAPPDGTEPEISCKSCSYGKHSPCIGYCLVKIMRELKVGRYAE